MGKCCSQIGNGWQGAGVRERGLRLRATRSAENLAQALCKSGNGSRSRLALPHNQYAPAHLRQLTFLPGVPLNVLRELAFPIPSVSLRHSGLWTTSVAMPETSVDKQSRPVFRQDNVRAPRKVTAMEAKPVAKPMEK